MSEVILIITTNNGEDTRFGLTRNQAKLSKLIEGMLEDEAGIAEIPLYDVDEESIVPVIEWMKRHENDPMKEIPKPMKPNPGETDMLRRYVGDWDADFIHGVFNKDKNFFWKVYKTVNYMDIEPLLILFAAMAAQSINGKELPEVQEMMGLSYPTLTPEYEFEVRKAHPWVLDVLVHEDSS